mmetsp:Transcript_15061/g.21034  ORF Transcript_15061/g.21034 Transcript_15061/m.21034 type:complete len:191 (+) Transcript_15061:206-778(+)
MSGLDDDWEILPRQTSKPKAPILTLQSSDEESRQIEEEIRRQLMSRQEREVQIVDHQITDDTKKAISREESTDSAVSVALDTEQVIQEQQTNPPPEEAVPSTSSTQDVTEQQPEYEENTQFNDTTTTTIEQSSVDNVQSESTIRKPFKRTEYEAELDSFPPNTELKVIFGSLLAMAVHSIMFSPKAVEAF